MINTCFKVARKSRSSRAGMSMSLASVTSTPGYYAYMQKFKTMYPRTWAGGLKDVMPSMWLDPSVHNSNFFYVKLQKSRKKGRQLEANIQWSTTSKTTRLTAYTKARMKYVTSCMEYFIPMLKSADRADTIVAIRKGMTATCHRRSTRGKNLSDFMDDYLSETCGAHEFSILAPELFSHD